MQNSQMMTPENVRQIIDQYPSLAKCLRALYLELDASIVEGVEVYVANALAQKDAECERRVEEARKDVRNRLMPSQIRMQGVDGRVAVVSINTENVENIAQYTNLFNEAEKKLKQSLTQPKEEHVR